MKLGLISYITLIYGGDTISLWYYNYNQQSLGLMIEKAMFQVLKKSKTKILRKKPSLISFLRAKIIGCKKNDLIKFKNWVLSYKSLVARFIYQVL